MYKFIASKRIFTRVTPIQKLEIIELQNSLEKEAVKNNLDTLRERQAVINNNISGVISFS